MIGMNLRNIVSVNGYYQRMETELARDLSHSYVLHTMSTVSTGNNQIFVLWMRSNYEIAVK